MAHDPPQLEAGFELRVEPIDDRHALLTVRHGAIRGRFRAAVLTVPYPSGLARLLAAEPDVEVVIVERIRSGLAAAAHERGVGYLDLQGGGFLKGRDLVYYNGTASPGLPGIGAPSRTSPFAPKASRVVRALLSDPTRKWRVSHLAASVGLNPGNAHRTLASLQEVGLVEQDRERYVVPDPGSLLEAWADASRPPRQHVSLPREDQLADDVARIVTRLDGYASVSGELAAELLAPHLPAQSAIVHCLDADAFERLQPAARPPPLPWNMGAAPGRIVVYLSDEGAGQFGGSVGGLDLVSPQQLYVDLAHVPSRGRQAADEVRRQLLRY